MNPTQLPTFIYRSFSVYLREDGQYYAPAASYTEMYRTVAGVKRAVDKAIKREKKHK